MKTTRWYRTKTTIIAVALTLTPLAGGALAKPHGKKAPAYEFRGIWFTRDGATIRPDKCPREKDTAAQPLPSGIPVIVGPMQRPEGCAKAIAILPNGEPSTGYVILGGGEFSNIQAGSRGERDRWQAALWKQAEASAHCAEAEIKHGESMPSKPDELLLFAFDLAACTVGERRSSSQSVTKAIKSACHYDWKGMGYEPRCPSESAVKVVTDSAAAPAPPPPDSVKR